MATIPENLIPKSGKDMFRCWKCGKKFKRAIDPMTGKRSKYLYQPACKHYSKNVRMAIA